MVYTNGIWTLRTRAIYSSEGHFKDKLGSDGEADEPVKGVAVTEAWRHKGLWHASVWEASEGRGSKGWSKAEPQAKGLGFHPCSVMTVWDLALLLVNSVQLTRSKLYNSEPLWVMTPWRGGASLMGLNVLTEGVPRTCAWTHARPGNLRDSQRPWVGGHWLSGREEGPVVVGVCWNKSRFRKGQGIGPGEQGRVALGWEETVLLGFWILLCCQLIKNWPVGNSLMV